jgi:hypothetical protein
MDTLGGYIATIVVSLIIGYVSQFLKPRSKLLCWSPHNFYFDLKTQGVVLQTNSLTLQNVGRLPAEEIEIIHKQKPDFFELFPSMTYEETTNPNGEHVITIRNLGPKEWVLVQLLSYTNAPVVKNVRWKGGHATWVQIQPQRVWPRWLVNIVTAILFVGCGTLVYAAIRLGIYFARQAGYI